MSVLTTLALMATAVVAKVHKPLVNTDVEITKLKAQVDDLERRLKNLQGDLDGWMDIAQRWRARYEARRSDEAEILQAQAQAQHLMAIVQRQQAQYAQSQQHHQGLAQQNYFQVGLGQAQALEWCNCVPARHDMFLRGD
jgi:chromosome segregation ATPase